MKRSIDELALLVGRYLGPVITTPNNNPYLALAELAQRCHEAEDALNALSDSHPSPERSTDD